MRIGGWSKEEGSLRGVGDNFVGLRMKEGGKL